MYCIGESIKTINQKYILISATFVLVFLSSFFISTQIAQLFASPICLLITGFLLQKELLDQLQTFKKEYISKSFYALFIAVILQAALNLLSSLVLHPNTSPTTTEIIIPVVSVFTVLSAPLLEECVFRHIIYRTLQGNKQNFSVIASTISSLLFATMHMSTIGFLGYFAIGMIFCYYYHSTKNIYTTIIAHIIFNFIVIFRDSVIVVIGGN